VRIGMIGTGSFAKRGPLPAIAITPGVELAAVFDPNPAAARSSVDQWGGLACDSPEQLLSLPQVDAVMLVSPPATHAAVATAVLEAGKPLICEKPVTLGSRDVAMLAAMAAKRGLLTAVDHEYRYDPAMAKMRSLIRESYLGAVRQSSLIAIATFGADPRFEAMRYWNFHHSAALGGGMLPQYASHLLDLHIYLFGGLEAHGGYLPAFIAQKPTRPTALGAPDGPMRPVEAEDSGALAARLPGGGAAALSLSYIASSLPNLCWMIHGEEGALTYEGRDGWFGGRLFGARGWLGEKRLIETPPRRREKEAPDLNGWMQDLISELLMDYAAVLGGTRRDGEFATLADEVVIWRAIEAWRERSPWCSR
jgi:predicted dehydrogenase